MLFDEWAILSKDKRSIRRQVFPWVVHDITLSLAHLSAPRDRLGIELAAIHRSDGQESAPRVRLEVHDLFAAQESAE